MGDQCFTANEDAWLKQRVAEGYSASQLSLMFREEFGIARSRNSIIGRAHRLKLRVGGGREIARARDARKTAAKAQPAKRAAPKRQTKPGRIASMSIAPVAIEPTRKPVVECQPAQAPPTPIGKTLFALERGDCRWPIGDPQEAGFAFCALPREREDRPYCRNHNHMAMRAA